MDGILRCSRYAFGPNRLHYCGPDANKEMLAHIAEHRGDGGLSDILSKFETMYPYLELIARANGIRDPFDDRVVEAYWIGNDLLEGVGKEKLYWHLKDTLGIRKRIGGESFRELGDRMRTSGVPHHAFHVLNVWRRTGHLDQAHTPESVAECVVNIGEVTAVDGPWITVLTRPLLFGGGPARPFERSEGENVYAAGPVRTRKRMHRSSRDDRWYFGEPAERRLTRNLGQSEEIDDVVVGDTLSYHWGVPCETLSPDQAEHLRRYTLRSLDAVNGGS